MKSHYRGHKMAMWLNLIPQLHRPGDDDVSMRHHHFRERGDHYYAGIITAFFKIKKNKNRFLILSANILVESLPLFRSSSE